MSETRATAGAGPIFPPGRYGRRREPQPRRRWLVALTAAAVALAALAISVRLYQQYGQPDHDPRLRRQFEVTDSGVSVEFEVRKPSGQPATCVVRARAATGEEVGRARVDVPEGTQVVVTYRLATTKRPFAVDVPRCDARR